MMIRNPQIITEEDKFHINRGFSKYATHIVMLYMKLMPIESHKNVTLDPAASILPKAGGTAAELELVQVELAAAPQAPLSPARCLRAVVALQISEFLL